MADIAGAQEILESLGMPLAQQNERSALTLLALAGLSPRDTWKKASRRSMTISRDIMAFVKETWGRTYAPNSRETFRRQTLHQFMQAGIVDYNPDDPGLPTNSSKAHYTLTDAALNVVKAYKTPQWEGAVKKFRDEKGALIEVYRKPRKANMVPVVLPDGTAFVLSPGAHNRLQAAVVEQFAPRFAPGAKVLYLGDTAQKALHVDSARLTKLGVPVTEHDKLPDVVLYDEKKNWLYMIEVVTSHGPVSPTRQGQLEKMLEKCSAKVVFISAFPDFKVMKRHLDNIAWETEVWVAEIPDHLIHYNGDRFLGPR